MNEVSKAQGQKEVPRVPSRARLRTVVTLGWPGPSTGAVEVGKAAGPEHPDFTRIKGVASVLPESYSWLSPPWKPDARKNRSSPKEGCCLPPAWSHCHHKMALFCGVFVSLYNLSTRTSEVFATFDVLGFMALKIILSSWCRGQKTPSCRVHAHVWSCVHMCDHACRCMCVHTYPCESLYACHMHLCVCACLCLVWACVHMYACVHTCEYMWCMLLFVQVCIFVCMVYAHVSLYSGVYVCLCVSRYCVHVYIYVHVCLPAWYMCVPACAHVYILGCVGMCAEAHVYAFLHAWCARMSVCVSAGQQEAARSISCCQWPFPSSLSWLMWSQSWAWLGAPPGSAPCRPVATRTWL